MASGDTIYTATYKFKGDNSDLKSTVADNEKTVNNSNSKIGSVISGIGKVATVGMGAAATAVGVVAKSAIDAYGDYEQLTGGVETLFGESSDIVMQYARDAYKTAGMSANDYMETVTGFSARLLQGLGGDTEAAAKVADIAITDMADNANKMGTSIESIEWAYQGFAKQNYTMLDNLKLGYGGTASEMARLINNSGVLGDSMEVTAETVNNVSFDKIIEAIHKVQEDLGFTGTTAKEASSTIQGSLNMTKAAWENLLVGIADGEQDLGPLIDNFIQSIGTAAKNIIPVLVQSLSGIAEVIRELAPVITEQLPVLINEVLPPLLEAAGTILVALIQNLPSMITVLVTALIGVIPQLIEGIMAAIPLLFQGIVLLVQGLIQMIPTLLPQITQLIIGIVKMLNHH